MSLHSTWSASATARNWNCAGALTLAQQVAHLEKESEPAAWGTACHTVSEICLRGGHDAIELIDRVIKTKEHELTVDEEMAETAQVYIDYVRERERIATDPIRTHFVFRLLQIEQRFSLEKLAPPFDAGGTADAVIFFPAEKLLEVVDLKGGRGVMVEVADNKQLRTYALGAMLANPGLDIDYVKSTIVQPRGSHKDGAIRSETYHVIDLAEWTADLVAAMNLSAQAKASYAKVTGGVSLDAWADAYLKPGEHCKTTFCPARAICPAREKQMLALGIVELDEDGFPVLTNTAELTDPLNLSKWLDARDELTDFFNAKAALAHTLAESGVEIPNYQLSDKIGRRRWINKDDEDALREQLFLKADLTNDEVYDQKLKSPAQMEKLLGKRKHLLNDLIEIPVTGTNLVRTDKTTRRAVKPSVHKHFNVIE